MKKQIDIDDLVEAYEQEELSPILEQASDKELAEWEPLLLAESNRLDALLEHPDPFLLDIDKQGMLEDRNGSVFAVLMEVRDEQERRAGTNIPS